MVADESKKNLKSFNQMSEEDLSKITSKGGKASVESKRKRKAIKEWFKTMSEVQPADKICAKLQEGGFDEIESYAAAVAARTLMKAVINGDINAVKVVIDQLNENTADPLNDFVDAIYRRWKT